MRTIFVLVGLAVFVCIGFEVEQSVRCSDKGFEASVQIEDGVRREGASGGEWAALVIPLKNEPTPVGKDGVNVFNSVSYGACGVEPKWKRVVRYVEIRDPKLSAAINGRNRLPGRYGFSFRRAKISEKRDGDGLTSRGWGHFAHSLTESNSVTAPPKPKWLPADALTGENFVAFLDNGWLFRGPNADQYFWVDTS
jgi:hypothetical protein